MTNELQIFCSLPKCEKDADTECIDCEYMVREEMKKRMTNKEAKDVLQEQIDRYGQEYDAEGIEALETAIKVLEQTSWIPVSERLPEELVPVNITWINHNPESYYMNIKDKPFTATGVYFNGQWYWWSTLCTDMLAEYSHNYDDIIDDDIEITAWMPLPEPYKAESEE